MNAKKAVELGFADEVLFDRKDEPETEETEGEKDDGKEVEANLKEWQPYSTRIMGRTILDRLGCTPEAHAGTAEVPDTAEGDAQDVEPPEAGLTQDMSDKAVGEEPVEDKKEEAEEDEPDSDESDSDEAEETEKPPKPENEMPDVPVIGMDGKTANGEMPYDLLMKQLEFLK